MITIFTPTHDLRWLAETWATVKDQPGDWEWVIGCNVFAESNATPPSWADVVAIVGADTRVRVVELGEVAGVGDAKRQLCDAARGDILVELDHDDLMAPGALADIEAAFADPSIGFAYSDFAEFTEADGNPHVYPGSGWTTHPPSVIRDRVLIPMQAFEPTARSMCQILFAPNHVRAWRRSAYIEAGGHDPSMRVADDFDLMCRTFLTTRMVRIPKCLYVYRRRADGGNTWLVNSPEIQEACGNGANRSLPDCAQPMRLRDKYLHRLVEREAQLRNLPLIDMGGGLNCEPGWESLDVREGAVHVWDVFGTRHLPFEDSSVFAFRAFDFLEHGSDADALWLMDEIHRCLVPGGWLLSRTPHAMGIGASCDPTHVGRWDERRFLYWCHAGLRQYLPPTIYPRAAFQPVRLYRETLTLGPDPWRFDVPYVVADLVADKGQREAGRSYL
jgi:SAM-dependent methyltransferase